MQDWLIQLITFHQYAVYGVVIVLACVEGPILSIIFGALWRFGYVDFLPIYAALMLGDILGDTILYSVGYFFGHRFVGRFGKYLSITEQSVQKVTKIFHKHKTKILILSKLTNGLGFSIVTLVTAGMVKIPYWRFLIMNMIGQLIWTGALLAVGYFFGTAYASINSVLWKLSVAVAFVIVIFALNGYRKYMAKRANTLNV